MAEMHVRYTHYYIPAKCPFFTNEVIVLQYKVQITYILSGKASVRYTYTSGVLL